MFRYHGRNLTESLLRVPEFTATQCDQSRYVVLALSSSPFCSKYSISGGEFLFVSHLYIPRKTDTRITCAVFSGPVVTCTVAGRVTSWHCSCTLIFPPTCAVRYPAAFWLHGLFSSTSTRYSRTARSHQANAGNCHFARFNDRTLTCC